MQDPLAITAAVTVVGGVAGQAVARRLRVPAILPLLVLGVALGPDGLGIVRPAALGDGLRTVVGLAVAVILFEGGLSLKMEAFRLAGTAIRNLVLFGSLVTWALSGLAAALCFPALDPGLAALFGALVIVTGPTVIQPLIHAVRPRRRIADVLRGEGILIDPVGALYAVLVLEFLLEAGTGSQVGVTRHVLLAFGGRLLLGGALGAAGAWLLHQALERDVLAADLRNLGVLSAAIGLYALSEAVASESGVLTVTIAGFVLGWLHPRGIEEIEEFKGHMTVLLVSAVFILLSADLALADMAALGWRGVALVAAVILLVRPIEVLLCTRGTDLLPSEKLFLAWIAPRGIVAASVSSLFAIVLEANGEPGGRTVMAMTFAVIVGTVVVQGSTARLVARALGIAEAARNGFMIVGANAVGRAIGRALDRAGVRVVLFDTNPWQVQHAREEGLHARRANALDEVVMEGVDRDGIGNLLALTPNDGVNRLAVRLYAKDYGRGHVHAIRLEDSPPEEERGGTPYLFGRRLTFEALLRRLAAGATVATATVDEAVDVARFPELLEGAVPLFAFRGETARFLADDGELEVGDTVYYLRPA